MSLIHFCRVCGLYHEEPPWGITGHDATFMICDCCGAEFGLDDRSKEQVREYRQGWIQNGCEWFWRKSKPENWDLWQQLSNVIDDDEIVLLQSLKESEKS